MATDGLALLPVTASVISSVIQNLNVNGASHEVASESVSVCGHSSHDPRLA